MHDNVHCMHAVCAGMLFFGAKRRLAETSPEIVLRVLCVALQLLSEATLNPGTPIRHFRSSEAL